MKDLSEKSVSLCWKPPESDGGTPITSYIIESRPSARSNWSPVGQVKGDTLTFTAEDLKEGIEYHFRVIAVNSEGQSPALEAKETVKPEKKIGNLATLFIDIKLMFSGFFFNEPSKK